jgi:4a-hydroxytetrahydrobiopterin dehydratase
VELLDEETIRSELETLPGWERAGKAIAKEVRLADFRDAISYVNRVAEVAEARNHHPDIAIHWSQVTLTIWTHSAGGLTVNDFALARALDAL